jgi:hypothetical protein
MLLEICSSKSSKTHTFERENQKIFWGGALPPPQTPPPVGRDIPLPTPYPLGASGASTRARRRSKVHLVLPPPPLKIPRSATGNFKEHIMSEIERFIPNYNEKTIYSTHDIFRSSLGNDTVNDRLIISTNGTGTASYDPRPAVAEFLKKKSRRYREPDNELYTQRDFVAKFFRQNCSL